MPREIDLHKRKSNLREPGYTFVIATEGDTEWYYFDAWNNELKTQIELTHVPKKGNNGEKLTKSSPKQTLQFLKLFDKENNVSKSAFKELWLLTDNDRWGNLIQEVFSECEQLSYNFAMSNPCFELWLLLHHKNISVCSTEEKDKIFHNPKVDENWQKKARASRRYLEKLLVSICGSYSKSKLNGAHYIPHIKFAISNSEALIKDVYEPYPTHIGTQVYLLAKRILEKNEELPF